MSEVHTDTPPLLQYADAPARHGIVFETSANGLTITIPVPWWQQLMMLGEFGGILIIGFLVHVLAGIAVAMIALFLAVYYRRLGRPVVIELTADELRFRNVSPGETDSDRTFRRANVYDVKFVRHSGNLVVRVHGQEMFEVRPSRDAAIMTWLADTIRQALWPQPPSDA